MNERLVCYEQIAIIYIYIYMNVNIKNADENLNTILNVNKY